MRKLLALAVITAMSVVGSIANAASVDIFVTQQSAGSDQWDITATVNSAGGLGGIALLGNTSMNNLVTNSANPNISALDSGLVVDVLGDGTTSAMSINNTGTGVNIGSGLLGTLTISPVGAAGTNYGNVMAGDDLYGYTALDANGAPTDYSLTVTPFPAPEPGTLLLLGTGLAGLALVRRRMA